MKRLLFILILIVIFQSPTKADDIRDFQIEGMSIGDSLLDYLKISEIKKKKSSNKKLKIVRASISNNLKTYDYVQFWWFEDDKDFKIVGIAGEIIINNGLKGCKKKQKEIVSEIKNTLTEYTINEDENNYYDDKSGKSKVYHYALNFKNKDNINIQCYIFSKNYKKTKNMIDNLKVMIVTKEMDNHFRAAFR
ncbi:hypothetical protein OAM36_00800 [Candidatus Pelagibacter sp.]|nr:hypothetical protein [Candidatus Pelagibacter bacterium]MDC0408064.1 hypothetical protein [Candidatus Pelagibacter sp.]